MLRTSIAAGGSFTVASPFSSSVFLYALLIIDEAFQWVLVHTPFSLSALCFIDLCVLSIIPAEVSIFFLHESGL